MKNRILIYRRHDDQSNDIKVIRRIHDMRHREPTCIATMASTAPVAPSR